MRAVSSEPGLVLEDIIYELRDIVKRYSIRKVKSCLPELKSEPLVSEIVNDMISSIRARHCSVVCSKECDFLDALGSDVYAAPFVREVESRVLYSGRLIAEQRIDVVLREIIGVALQIIRQLPKKEHTADDGTKILRSLASGFENLSKRTSNALAEYNVRGRIYAVCGKSENALPIFQMPDHLGKLAAMLREVTSSTAVVREKTNGPNPQLSLTLYAIQWFEVASGHKQYSHFQTLLAAAFGDHSTPSWIDRLEIEMNRHLARRSKWIDSITVNSALPATK